MTAVRKGPAADEDPSTEFKAAVARGMAASSAISETGTPVEPGEGVVVGVQVASGVCAGATSGFLTTPLDIVKTRLQVLSGPRGRPRGAASGFGTRSGARRLSCTASTARRVSSAGSGRG